MHNPLHLTIQEDGDDEVYEALLPLPPPPPRAQPQQQGGYSWDALHVSSEPEPFVLQDMCAVRSCTQCMMTIWSQWPPRPNLA
jgi:hypothetical protein